MKRFVFFSALLFSIVLLMSQAEAFRLTPFRAQFEPFGAAANQSFIIENNTDNPATVQVSILSRDIDTDGKETTAETDGEFTVYPEQVVLKPHEARTVRVQWTGGEIKTEKAYRIVAEQLPVNLDRTPPKGGVVRFLVNYMGALFVTPPGLQADVSLDSIKQVNQDGQKMMELVFNNKGQRHAMLEKLTLDFKNGVVLSDIDDLKGAVGETLLAGHKRRLLIAWPKGLNAIPQSADFTYDKKAF